MNRVCYISGKNKLKGNSVSHAQNKTIKHNRPNLRKVKLEENGKVKTVKVAMKVFKKLKRDEVKGVKMIKTNTYLINKEKNNEQAS